MAEKVLNYVGKGKPIGNFDDIIFYIDTKKVTPNDRGFINKLRIKKLREPDKNGMTHTIFVDDFVPTKRTDTPSNPAQVEETFNNNSQPMQENLRF